MSTPPPKKVRIKYYNKYKNDWKEDFGSWLHPHRSDEYKAWCAICGKGFSVRCDGRAAVQKHSEGLYHTESVKAAKSTASMELFTVKEGSLLEDKVTAAELTETFHGVRHHHSYNSQDCGNSLNKKVFSDSKIASLTSCGRTKATALSTNVLGPAFTELLLEEISEIPYVGVGSDASNKGNQKMFPVTLTFFSRKKGLCNGLLAFYEDPFETSLAIFTKLTGTLCAFKIPLSKLSSYSADSASVNYGKHNSVFQKLSDENEYMIQANCHCHLDHNTAKHGTKVLLFDVEAFVLKVYSEFSSSSLKSESLKEFCDFTNVEYKQILRHISVRWLSLMPAVERILLSWPALRSYFLSLGEDEVCGIVWQAFETDPTESVEKAYCYFVHHIMSTIFHPMILKFENESFTCTELHEEMCKTREECQNRLRDSFYGSGVKNIFKSLDSYAKTKCERSIRASLERSVSYLEKWYDFENSKFRKMAVLSLKDEPSFDQLTDLASDLHVDVDEDKLYTDFTLLRKNFETINASSADVDKRWKKCFAIADVRGEGNEIFKLVAFVLSITVSNSYCERVFSVMEMLWRKERSCMKTELVQAELLICLNFEKMTCSKFYDFAKNNTNYYSYKLLEVLKNTISRRKKFKEKC